ncbi:retrovirus-related pol polyprotein from transposon TNT 1-94 [Tanacetum coccineum]
MVEICDSSLSYRSIDSVIPVDDLFIIFQQFKKLLIYIKSKEVKKSHDPLGSSTHNVFIIKTEHHHIIVTHPTSVGEYDDDTSKKDVQNNSEDPLVSAMQYIQQFQVHNLVGQGQYARNCSKPRVSDLKYFMEKMLLEKQDEAGVILTDEQNDFLFADASRMEEIEELSANICLMASEINSNIKFDSFKGNVNSGSVDKDTHVPDLCAVENLARNAYQEAEKQRIFAKQVQTQNTHLTSTDEMYKERAIVSELDELEKQNDLLKDQLLEASLKHDVELCVLLNHECIDKILNAELQQVKKKSFEIQEGLQARIKILEKDVQRCQKQSVDFELQLQHEKEKHKWDSTLINKNTNPLDYSWISKLEKLENENVSLDFKVQSLIKERDNVKLEYQKLFDSIKKTRSQTQKEMDELIVHVSEKTYAYGAIRAENQNLLSTISELKTRLEKVEKGKSVNTKFDKTNGSQSLLCVTPLNKHAFQKKTDVPKTEENHVVSKPVTLQTSPTKQTGANQNTNVIRPGMYRVVTTQESQTNKTKSALSSTGMNATSRVRRPMSRDSHVAHSVLDNSKKAAKNVAVYVRKNKQTDNTSANVISNKENVIDVDVANASKAKTLLCVSCMQNVLIPCHDKCLAKLKLNVRSNVRRTFFTNSRTSKSSETTFVAPKTRFSEKETQSKTLDTTSVVSKSKIDVESASKAKDKVVQIILWVVDSGCSKHMTGDRSLLRNFIGKFMGTVRFGNDNFAAITGYGDYIHGNITIYHVYYVEGLGRNLYSVGQFCARDLEVAFYSNTCYIRNLEGNDLLTGGRKSNLYTISISNMGASSPVCLMSKATSTKSLLWHRRLSHLNISTINDLTRLDLVDGLPKFKYGKDHLYSSCERGKSKKASHPPKLVPSDHSKLELLHMDLCGPLRVASINGKKYILVIVDDYSRYTWVYFLRSKDETPEIIKKLISQAQLNYKAKVCKIRTDNGTEFKNTSLKAHYEKLGIMQ